MILVLALIVSIPFSVAFYVKAIIKNVEKYDIIIETAKKQEGKIEMEEIFGEILGTKFLESMKNEGS